MNKRISPKERGLIKGALRRVFSRSDLRRRVIELTIVKVTDSTRPRVKRWSQCPMCETLTPTYLMQVDHVAPIVPLETTLEEMSWDTVVDRMWCEEKGLQGICKICHSRKTKAENKQRRQIRKQNKK